MRKAVVLLSGGLDSATVLAYAINRGYEVIAVNAYYGQQHSKEIACARNIAHLLGVHDLREVDLTTTFKGLHSSLLKDSKEVIKDKKDADKNQVGETYVPARNAILLSIGAAIADSEGAEVVMYGAHAEDNDGYPDCRPAFVSAMSEALRLGTVNGIRLEVPFLYDDKARVVAEGNYLAVPFAHTWSCYRGGDLACGTCPTCIQRLEAFAGAGLVDPIKYEPGVKRPDVEKYNQAGGKML